MQTANLKFHWLLTSLLLALIVSVGCTASSEPGAIEPTATPEEIILHVAPDTVECVGVAPQTCLRVKTDASGDWELFYDTIEGFTHEAGYTYELRVNKIPVTNPPADSSVQYELIEVVSKTPADEPISEATGDKLDGTKWTLTAMGPDASPVTPLPDSPIDLEFKEGQVLGNAGCNQFFASYTLSSVGEISIGAAGSTMMACPEDVMAQEDQFLAALQTVTSYELEEGTLTIQYEGGTLQFTVAVEPEALPLEGTMWQLTTFFNDNAASSLLNGSEITATFAQGQVNGTAGCNSYFGSYEIESETITFSPLGSTRMACAPEIMAQESNFLAALRAATAFQIEGEQLTVRGDAGSLIFSGAPQPATEAADQVTWEEALALLNDGQVTEVFQTHSLQVTLTLKDGRDVHTVEPAIDAIFAAVSECGDPCAGITLVTE